MAQNTENSSSEMISLGQKWECFSCSAKFYDLGRSPVLCPKCSADQEDQEAAAATGEGLAKEKKKATRAKKKPSKKAVDEEE